MKTHIHYAAQKVQWNKISTSILWNAHLGGGMADQRTLLLLRSIIDDAERNWAGFPARFRLNGTLRDSCGSPVERDLWSVHDLLIFTSCFC